MSTNVTQIRSKGELCKVWLANLLDSVMQEISSWEVDPKDFLRMGMQGSVKALMPLVKKNLKKMTDDEALTVCKGMSDVLFENLVELESILKDE